MAPSNKAPYPFIPPAVEARRAYLAAAKSKSTLDTSEKDQASKFNQATGNTSLPNKEHGKSSRVSQTIVAPERSTNTNARMSPQALGYRNSGSVHPATKYTDFYNKWDDFEGSYFDLGNGLHTSSSLERHLPMRGFTTPTDGGSVRHHSDNRHGSNIVIRGPKNYFNVNSTNQRNTDFVTTTGITQRFDLTDPRSSQFDTFSCDLEREVNVSPLNGVSSLADSKNSQGHRSERGSINSDASSATKFKKAEGSGTKGPTLRRHRLETWVMDENRVDGLTCSARQSATTYNKHMDASQIDTGDPSMKLPYSGAKPKLHRNIEEVEAKMGRNKRDLENANLRLAFAKNEFSRKEQELYAAACVSSGRVNSLGRMEHGLHLGGGQGFPNQAAIQSAFHRLQIDTGDIAYYYRRIKAADRSINDHIIHGNKLQKAHDRLCAARKRTKARHERRRKIQKEKREAVQGGKGKVEGGSDEGEEIGETKGSQSTGSGEEDGGVEIGAGGGEGEGVEKAGMGAIEQGEDEEGYESDESTSSSVEILV